MRGYEELDLSADEGGLGDFHRKEWAGKSHACLTAGMQEPKCAECARKVLCTWDSIL